MNVKRRLLFAGYKFLKRAGYFEKRDASSAQANILMFHRVNSYDQKFISEDSSDQAFLTTRTDIFEQMLHEISRGYHPMALSTLVGHLRNNRALPSRTVVITFDDGYKDNYLYAAPLLRKYGIPATFFVTTGFIGTNREFAWDEKNPVKHPMMTWDEVSAMSQMGFEIGAHTVNHVDLGKVSLETARKEVSCSREHLEKQLKKEVTFFAYPFGRQECIRPEVIEIIKEAGFECCCSGYGGKVTQQSDLFNLCRIAAYPSPIELLMELDDFMTFYNGTMSLKLGANWNLKLVSPRRAPRES